MPCYDPQNYELDAATERFAKEYKVLKDELDIRTSQLCELCGELEKRSLLPILSGRTRQWWNEHRKWDGARKV